MLINIRSRTYTCLTESSYAEAHPGEKQTWGECLPSSLQFFPDKKDSLSRRSSAVWSASSGQWQEFLYKCNSEKGLSAFKLQNTPRVVNSSFTLETGWQMKEHAYCTWSMKMYSLFTLIHVPSPSGRRSQISNSSRLKMIWPEMELPHLISAVWSILLRCPLDVSLA